MIHIRHNRRSCQLESGDTVPQRVCLDDPGDDYILFSNSDQQPYLDKYNFMTVEDVTRPLTITVGVHPKEGGCQLSCPYCSNNGVLDGQGLHHSYDANTYVSRHTTPPDAVAALIDHICRENQTYTILWAVGEPFSAAGLTFWEALLDLVPVQQRAFCTAISLTTNCVQLEDYEEKLFSAMASWGGKRILNMSVALFEETRAHRSVLTHKIPVPTKKYGKIALKIFLPTTIDLSSLPAGIETTLVKTITDLKPDIVEPHYLWRFVETNWTRFHHCYYPNIAWFSLMLARNKLLPEQVYVHSGPAIHYNLIYQGDNQWAYPNGIARVGTVDITREMMKLWWPELPARCVECPGVRQCPIAGRRDHHQFMATIDSGGPDIAECVHRQLRDQGAFESMYTGLIALQSLDQH